MAENVYLLEIELGHQIDGDGWTQSTIDYFYVADGSGSKRVKKQLCLDLSYVDDIDLSPYWSKGMCSDGVHLYVCHSSNDANDKIQKYLLSDLSLVLEFGSTGAGDDQFSNPHMCCTDGTHLYITDYGNDRIKKHKCSDLTYVAQVGSTGAATDQFNFPTGICTDGTHIYIADRLNYRIKKHKCSDLSYVAMLGSQGTGDDQFDAPNGICTDDTYLYITDNAAGAYRIKKHLCADLSYDSEISDSPGANAISYPYGIDTDGIYNYHTSQDNFEVQKRLNSDLSFDSKQGSEGVADDQYKDPWNVGFSQEGQNSYYISHVEGKPSKVEEDGVALTERGTLTLCNDNAGSWYWDLANTRLYVHTTGSDDPAGYIIIAFFWEYLTNAQYVDEDIIFNGNEYLPYLNDNDIPDVTNETSGYQSGGTRQSFGSVRIINADGRYDTRLTDYIYEAKKIILKAGIKGGNYASYDTYWIGWTGGIKWSEEEIDIDIEDLRTLHA